MGSGWRLSRRATVLLVIATLGLANGGQFNVWQRSDLNFRFLDATNETAVVIQDEPDIANTVRKDQDEEGVLNYNVDLELEKPEGKVGELVQPEGKSEIFEITVKNFPPSMLPSMSVETSDDSRRNNNKKAGSFSESQKVEDKNVILSVVPPGSTHEKNEEEVEILLKVTETDKNNNSSSSPDSPVRGEGTENIIIKLFFQKPLELLADKKNTNTDGSNEIKDPEQLAQPQNDNQLYPGSNEGTISGENSENQPKPSSVQDPSVSSEVEKAEAIPPTQSQSAQSDGQNLKEETNQNQSPAAANQPEVGPEDVKNEIPSNENASPVVASPDNQNVKKFESNPEVSSPEAQPETVPAKKVAPPTENDSPVVVENSPETPVNDNSDKVENNPEVPALLGSGAQPEPVPVRAEEVVPTNENVPSDVVSPPKTLTNGSFEKGENNPEVPASVVPEAQTEPAKEVVPSNESDSPIVESPSEAPVNESMQKVESNPNPEVAVPVESEVQPESANEVASPNGNVSPDVASPAEIPVNENIEKVENKPEVAAPVESEVQPEPAKEVDPLNTDSSPVVASPSDTPVNESLEKVESNPEVPASAAPESQPEPAPAPAKEVDPSNANASPAVASPSEVPINESIEKVESNPEASAPVEPEAQPESVAVAVGVLIPAPSTEKNQSEVAPTLVETVSDDEHKFWFNRPSPVAEPSSNSSISHPPAAEGDKELQPQQQPIIFISNVTNLSLTLGQIKPASEKSPASVSDTMAVASPDPQFMFPGGLFGGAGAGQGGGGGQPFGGMLGNLFTMMNQMKPGLMGQPGAPAPAPGANPPAAAPVAAPSPSPSPNPQSSGGSTG